MSQRYDPRTMPRVNFRNYVLPPPLDGFIANLRYWDARAAGYAKDAILASRNLASLR